MTLGFFTDPYPDELLYSACARFIELSRYPNALDGVRDLFGNQQISAMVDLPNRINRLISAMPNGHRHTADRFINDHTLFPFYAPFLPPDRARKVRHEMKMDGDNRIRARLGILAGGVLPPTRLRYCPKCVSEDRKRYGETYWHRNHQITGAEVCFIHEVFLESSLAPWQERGRHQNKFYSAEQAVPIATPRFLDKSNKDHSLFLSISCDVAWLLSQRDLSLDNRELRNRYYKLLLKRSYAYYNGRIKTYGLSEDLIRFYSQDVLRQFQSEITHLARGWVYRLVHTHTLNVAQYPIRHLLLLKFLGQTAKGFFTAFNGFKPFGDGPWPCLNQASDHYKELVIQICKVTDNIEKRGTPMGTFDCTRCGFIYNRSGPDTSYENRFQANSIQTYGPVWEKVLREIWGDISLSTVAAGRRLGVSNLTVVRHAIRFRLPMNTPGSRRVSKKTIQRYSSFRPSREETLKHYRQQWLAVRNANPEAGRNKLYAIASFLSLWLNKNDHEWFEAHLPSPHRKRSKGARVDWKKIDSELSVLVATAAKRIKNLTGKPVRASLAEIIREVGYKVWLELRLSKLPYTEKALNMHLESLEAFAIRKIKWTESCFQQEGRCPTRLQLMVRAVVRNKTGGTQAVQNAIDAAMERLRIELH